MEGILEYAYAYFMYPQPHKNYTAVRTIVLIVACMQQRRYGSVRRVLAHIIWDCCAEPAQTTLEASDRDPPG